MADRYWVGGSGTWNTTSTTNWSASSGGASGASVPTVADNVFFDQAGTYTVTMTGALACLDITVSSGTVTFATGTSPTLTIRGSMSLVAGTVWSSTGPITFTSTSTGRTVTTNGVTISGNVTFNGVGGGWTLGSALTTTGSLTVAAGTFDTSSIGNYSVTYTQFDITGATARTVNLNGSTLTSSIGSALAFNAGTTTNLTFNAGTSQINLTAAAGAGISSGGLTFYNVAFTGVNAASKAHAVTGVNTFNNFAVTATSAAGVTTVTFAAQQTINGTLSTTGTAGNRRVFFTTATYGISYDLVVNSAPSLTDADFRGLYVTGTSAPISGTRVGNRGECRNITFDTPKTVYWNLAGAQNWSANGWTDTPTGTPNTDFFPLPQDTATFTNAGSVTGTITLDTAIGYVSTVDMSGRTSAMTLGLSNPTTVYGNWTNGSGTAFTGTSGLTFSGGTTQTITSAGKTFQGAIAVNTFGGTVELADALNNGTNFLTVTNGTFDTKNFNVTAGTLSSFVSAVRTINFRSSTVTLRGISFFATNLTFNAGTSQINLTGTAAVSFAGAGMTFNNVSYTATSLGPHVINGANRFNNLTFAAPVISGVMQYSIESNQTINGTFTCNGASAIRRIFLRSDTVGTPRILTAASLSAQDCDFRNITIAGAAAGTAPTRAGNCGGNTGVTFPAAKTVYWNLAGTQNWNATGWATSSGGVPDINNFPLAQDTAVFDNTGAVGTVTVNSGWNIGTLNMSARTTACAIDWSNGGPSIYGNVLLGTGVTPGTIGVSTLCGTSTQTITSSGCVWSGAITVNHPSVTVQLADALTLIAARTLTLTTGTFDAVTYNVTTGLFLNSSSANTLRMGAGTWTLTGTGTVWNISASPTIVAGTSTIVLSDTSTTARTFAGGSLYYNKLTIGGTTGTSTLTITGTNIFGEIASTKTVAHTIVFPSGNTTTIGKWSVTGAAGNVVTLAPSTAATAYTISIAGPATSGIDYLSVSYCAVATNPASPGEFYVGTNSTNTAGNTGAIIFTATPTPRTLYWVGGTGNWSDTARWSTTSGSGSGAAIPTSLDAVIFDSGSNATAYTATIDAGVTFARCASFTMAGPASGSVTFAGAVNIAFHGSVSFASTGITRTYTGAMFLAGNSSYTFTTNGLALSSTTSVIGVGSTWTLGSALNNAGTVSITYGSFSTSTSNYSLTAIALSSNNSNIRTLSLNGATVAVSAGSATVISFTPSTNFTFDAGTSQINISNATSGIASGGLTFNNVSFTSATATSITITGVNTFNTLSFAGLTTAGITPVTFSANQTIGTLTMSAGTTATNRTFLRSDTIGTQRTLTVTTLTAGAANYDFRDIAITGAAAPLTGTRFGDAKGNSGITFDAPKTVYWNLAGSNNWSATAWATSAGGTPASNNFPLAQDTAVFTAISPASFAITTVNADYNIGTIDMSLRTSNPMTLATGTTAPTIFGNWINGTGTALTGSGVITFAGRGAQTITSAGKTFTQGFTFNNISGAVTLQDAFSTTSTSNFTVASGTFNANNFNFTLTAGTLVSSAVATKTIAIGSGTWTLGSSLPWGNPDFGTTTFTGTGTISLTSASAKNFSGNGLDFSGITLNQGGVGTLTIVGNNTFKDITNSYSATGATTIALGSTTQTLTNPWTATGQATRVLTVSGTSAASPATLIFSGAGTAASVDFLNISNVRAYDLVDEWYAGPNSTNLGSLGWYFSAVPSVVSAAGNFFLLFFPT